MTQNQLMTAGAVALALVAVVYAFKRPAQAATTTRAGVVTDWARQWDAMAANLDLSANMADYNNTLAGRGWGFTL